MILIKNQLLVIKELAQVSEYFMLSSRLITELFLNSSYCLDGT